MEEEKRKKKNKKKKGKQTKTPEDEKPVTETRSIEQNHIKAGLEQNHRTHILEGANGQLAGASDADSKQNRDHIDAAKGTTDSWLEEGSEYAQCTQDQMLQVREADLERRFIDLQHEKDSWFQEKAIIEEKIEQLLHEKSSWILKEASFEDKIKQLERERESWVSKENLDKEAIARMSEENMEALTQVKVLQEARDSLFQENQRLMGSISVLQSQIQQFEMESSSSSFAMTKKHISEVEDTNAQLEAASMLVEKLMTENAELVEKVNELYVELSRQGKVAEHSLMARHDPVAETSETAPNSDYVFRLKEEMSESSKKTEYETVDQTNNEKISVDYANGGSIPVLTGIPYKEDAPGSYEADETEEIVQIPLDENETHEVELHGEETTEKVGVPLSDAPLTGAPFRLISFVARYVSGADLVDKTSNSVR